MRRAITISLISLIASLCIWVEQSTYAAEKKFTWMWSHGITIPNTEYEKVGTVDLPREVDKATEGRLEIKPLIGVFDPLKNLFDTRDGRCQGATVTCPYYGATLPLLVWQNVPGLISTYAEHRKAYEEIKDLFAKGIEEHGVKFMFYAAFHQIHIYTKKPIEKLEDFKGKKIRTASLLTGQLLNLLGASSMTLPLAEVYMAAQRGVIDGFDMSVGPALGLKLHEVSGYAVSLPLGHPAFLMVVNNKAFNSVPADIQKAVLRVGQQLTDGYWPRLEIETNAFLKELAAKGVKYNELPDEDMKVVFEKAKEVQENWLALEGPHKELRKTIYQKVKAVLGR
jgi:TRAP-type C4-dicarboxylate transport system substrate-binding protein